MKKQYILYDTKTKQLLRYLDMDTEDAAELNDMLRGNNDPRRWIPAEIAQTDKAATRRQEDR